MSHGDVVANIRVNDSGVQPKLDETANRFKSWGQSIQQGVGLAIGQKLTGYAMRIPGMLFEGLVKSIDLAREQETSEKRLATVLRATGDAAGWTVQQLKDLAEERQRVTNFSATETMGAMGTLATFPNISGSMFEDATKAAQDLAAVTGQDLNSAMIQIGKALNEPEQGLMALTRVGVQFSEEQREMIRVLMQTGHQLEAQEVIMARLAQTTGLAAKNTAGSQAGFNNALNTFLSGGGKLVLPSVNNFLRGAGEMMAGQELMGGMFHFEQPSLLDQIGDDAYTRPAWGRAIDKKMQEYIKRMGLNQGQKPDEKWGRWRERYIQNMGRAPEDAKTLGDNLNDAAEAQANLTRFMGDYPVKLAEAGTLSLKIAKAAEQEAKARAERAPLLDAARDAITMTAEAAERAAAQRKLEEQFAGDPEGLRAAQHAAEMTEAARERLSLEERISATLTRQAEEQRAGAATAMEALQWKLKTLGMTSDQAEQARLAAQFEGDPEGQRFAEYVFEQEEAERARRKATEEHLAAVNRMKEEGQSPEQKAIAKTREAWGMFMAGEISAGEFAHIGMKGMPKTTDWKSSFEGPVDMYKRMLSAGMSGNQDPAKRTANAAEETARKAAEFVKGVAKVADNITDMTADLRASLVEAWNKAGALKE